MLRPERMSKVSVTGSKTVMDDVVETVHDLHLVHLSDYDGAWEGFSNGDPMAGGDEASEKLVTVRSLKSILGVTDEDAGPSRIVTDEALDEELEEIRVEANELDDRRSELRDELREVRERQEALEPFAELGIDLDLLWGYDSLSVAVGEGDADAVERALAGVDGAAEVFSEGDVVAAFVHADEDALSDALVEAQFSGLDVPHEEGDPEEALAELEHRENQLEAKLETVESEIEDLRYDAAGFLLAAEEKLSIQARKAEAPLSFATTRNAFVAEGWIPTERVGEFEAAIHDAVGDHADVEELEVAEYSRHGHAETQTEVDREESGAAAGSVGAAAADEGDERETGAEPDAEPAEATADGGESVRSDGGVVTMDDDGPPVIQDNPDVTNPFELLTRAVGHPNYTEFDPTIILFLTFPTFFGFMIADVGYGAIYMAIGYYLYRRFDSDGMQNIGLVTVWAGFFTAFFGFFFGEIFGLHLITSQFWDPVFGGVPLHKGLTPNHSTWALGWFLVIALVGVLHLDVAYLLEFLEEWNLHGARDAVIHSGSWLLAMNGLWLFILARPPTVTEAGETAFVGPKPDFIYTVFDHGSHAALELGFGGVPSPVAVGVPVVGAIPFTELVGVAMILAGAVMLAVGPAYELVEFHLILAHPLSYLRIGAELLAEVGLAFAVNLLFWGAYATESEHGQAWHFALTHMPKVGEEVHHETVTQILFPGLVHMGPVFVVLGVFVLVAGTFIVLALGVMSVGIQAIRLEYFEFFSKFYEGDGTPYVPFGTEREYTEENS